jgi:hypothetical protein
MGDTKYSKVLVFVKKSNNLFSNYIQSHMLVEGKVPKEYLFSNEERVIEITPLWRLLYGP